MTSSARESSMNSTPLMWLSLIAYGISWPAKTGEHMTTCYQRFYNEFLMHIIDVYIMRLITHWHLTHHVQIGCLTIAYKRNNKHIAIISCKNGNDIHLNLALYNILHIISITKMLVKLNALPGYLNPLCAFFLRDINLQPSRYSRSSMTQLDKGLYIRNISKSYAFA